MIRTFALILLVLAAPAGAQTFDTIGYVLADGNLVTDIASNTYWQDRDTVGTVYTAGPNDSVTKVGGWIESCSELAVQIWNWNSGTSHPTTMFFSDTNTVTTTSSLKSWTLGTKVALVPGNKYSMAYYTVTCSGSCITKRDQGGSLGVSWDSTQTGVTSSFTPDVSLDASGILTAFAEVEQWPAAGGSLTVGTATVGAATVGGK